MNPTIPHLLDIKSCVYVFIDICGSNETALNQKSVV
jgi:hypothetical protein